MARKKIEELIEDGVIEGEEVKEKWSVGKIFIGLLMALFLGYFTAILLSDVSAKLHDKATQILTNTKEIANQPVPHQFRLPTTNDVLHVLEQLNMDITSSSGDNSTASHSAFTTIIHTVSQFQHAKPNIKDMTCSLPYISKACQMLK